MIAAVATLFCFAITPVFANRAAGTLGSLPANFWRLLVAVLALGAWAHLAGGGFAGAGRAWFVFGGVVGFGLGGVAMFQSLPRLGSNLSTLIVQCGAAVVAAVVEWTWLGTALTPVEVAWAALALAGVITGLMPRSLPRVSPRQWTSGLVWAALSAFGQGAGAVISRKAFAVTRAAGETIDPGTAAYQRAFGGVAIALLAWLMVEGLRTRRFARPSAPEVAEAGRRRRAIPWVLANALSGPILGVTCYQWALRTTPAGIVQPIVAAAPLLTIPFAAWLERQRPRLTYYIGAALAVAGVIGLMSG